MQIPTWWVNAGTTVQTLGRSVEHQAWLLHDWRIKSVWFTFRFWEKAAQYQSPYEKQREVILMSVYRVIHLSPLWQAAQLSHTSWMITTRSGKVELVWECCQIKSLKTMHRRLLLHIPYHESGMSQVTLISLLLPEQLFGLTTFYLRLSLYAVVQNFLTSKKWPHDIKRVI